MNMQRNQGLLTMAQEPPVDRTPMLSRLDEALVGNGSRYQLSCSQYGAPLTYKGTSTCTGFAPRGVKPQWLISLSGRSNLEYVRLPVRNLESQFCR